MPTNEPVLVGDRIELVAVGHTDLGDLAGNGDLVPGLRGTVRTIMVDWDQLDIVWDDDSDRDLMLLTNEDTYRVLEDGE